MIVVHAAASALGEHLNIYSSVCEAFLQGITPLLHLGDYAPSCFARIVEPTVLVDDCSMKFV